MAGILNSIQISAQGLSVQRQRMNTTAENIANAETTRTEDGTPYRRKRVVVEAKTTTGTFDSMLKTAGMSIARTNPGHMGSRRTSVTRRVELPTVRTSEIADSESAFRLEYDPSHPDADEDGYVQMPDIDVITEMVDMMAATRAYEANTVAISSAKKMAKDALEI
jgi:flagellar basal-body rod protein FlgC